MGSSTSPLSLLFASTFEPTTSHFVRSPPSRNAALCLSCHRSLPLCSPLVFLSHYILARKLIGASSVAVSLTLANPLPVPAIMEARGIAVELNAREFPVVREIFRREASAFAESDVDPPHNLARGGCFFPGFKPGVRVFPHRVCAYNLMTATTVQLTRWRMLRVRVKRRTPGFLTASFQRG